MLHEVFWLLGQVLVKRLQTTEEHLRLAASRAQESQ